MMRLHKIAGDVTNNLTVTTYGGTESGCRIHVTNDTHAQFLWELARDRYDLKCAHIEKRNNSSGCVHDVFSTSKCPGKLN